MHGFGRGLCGQLQTGGILGLGGGGEGRDACVLGHVVN